MKRRYRLADKERFRQVRQAGTSYAHRLLVLCALRNDQAISRSGFTVSRRIGNAVARNRARRRMSEAVRLVWDMVEPGWDMVWIARPAMNRVQFPVLQSTCVDLLQRARILRIGSEDVEEKAEPGTKAPESSGESLGSVASSGEGS